MAIGGSDCTLSHGESCAACGNGVPRRSPHAHSFLSTTGHSVLCADCYDLILLAARSVFEAVEAVGIKRPTPRLFAEWLNQGRLAVLIQGQLSI